MAMDFTPTDFTAMYEANMNRMILFLVLYFFCITTIAAVSVITVVHIIMRFVNNFMKDQGSLMFTLPVTIWTLLTAKVIAAFCITLMSTIAVCVSIFLFARGIIEEAFALMAEAIRIPIPNSGEIMIIAFVVCAIIVHQICRIHLAITISHLLPRFRFAAGCGIYLALSFFLEQPISRFAYKNVGFNLTSLQDSIYSVFDNDFYISWIPSGIASLAFTALYFWVTGILLKRTFNLE
jgi:hypothetical protein